MREECPNGAFGLHAFDYTIVSDSTDHVEECTQCGDRAFYRVIDKRIDTVKYRKDHERDFLQPSDPRFTRLYGTEGIKVLQEHVERKIKLKRTREEMIPIAREHLQSLKRTTFMLS